MSKRFDIVWGEPTYGHAIQFSTCRPAPSRMVPTNLLERWLPWIFPPSRDANFGCFEVLAHSIHTPRAGGIVAIEVAAQNVRMVLEVLGVHQFDDPRDMYRLALRKMYEEPIK